LHGATYGKDNRLLPRGFDPSKAGSEVAVYGTASEDLDFLGGGDVLELAIDLAGSTGPLTVRVEMLYQSIGFRWADNLRSVQADEPERFIRYYETVNNLPQVVDSIEIQVE
jgi:hypothetical protein